MKKTLCAVALSMLMVCLFVVPSFAIGGNIPVNRDGLSADDLESVEQYLTVPQLPYMATMNNSSAYSRITFSDASNGYSDAVMAGLYQMVMDAYYQGEFKGYIPFAILLTSSGSGSSSRVQLCAVTTSVRVAPSVVESVGTNGHTYLQFTAGGSSITPSFFYLTNVGFVFPGELHSTGGSSSSIDRDLYVKQYITIEYSNYARAYGATPTYYDNGFTGDATLTDTHVQNYLAVLEIRRKMLSTVQSLPVGVGDFTSYDSGVYVNGYNKGYDLGMDYGYDVGYEDGEANGGMTPDELESIYDDGYNAGVTHGEEIGYTNGFEIGQNVGFDAGYDRGENEGYIQGQRDGSSLLDIGGVISSVPTAAKGIINDAFGFELFGINVAGLLSALLVVGIIAFVVKWLMSR